MKTPRTHFALATIAASALLALALPATAQTTIKDGWVRGTVAQQKATGAFMHITSVQGGKLVGVMSAAAGVAEIHEMKMDGSTMQMRALPALDLPAGKAVELKPGGHHLMLMDLKAALVAGQSVPLTLVIEGKDGKRERVELMLPVKALGAGPDMSKGMGKDAHKH